VAVTVRELEGVAVGDTVVEGEGDMQLTAV
jgi:hypothetical protein